MALIYKIFLFSIFGFAGLVFILLFFVSAPYGKFQRQGWGLTLKAKWAWSIMEFPSLFLMTFFFITSPSFNLPGLIFWLLWAIHYFNRTFVYPFFNNGREKPFPVILVAMAFLFNVMNGFVNGYSLFHLAPRDPYWLNSWQFITGLPLFTAGLLINRKADRLFMKLRQGGEKEYKIPRGWLFNYISCPHYFGEIIEWGGWALMTFSLPGLAFFIFTFANLFPRAITSHHWYIRHFPDYPSSRKAVIPFVV